MVSSPAVLSDGSITPGGGFVISVGALPRVPLRSTLGYTPPSPPGIETRTPRLCARIAVTGETWAFDTLPFRMSRHCASAPKKPRYGLSGVAAQHALSQNTYSRKAISARELEHRATAESRRRLKRLRLLGRSRTRACQLRQVTGSRSEAARHRAHEPRAGTL